MYNKQLMKMDGMKQKTGLRWKCIVLKTFNQKVKNQYPTLLLKKLQQK